MIENKAFVVAATLGGRWKEQGASPAVRLIPTDAAEKRAVTNEKR